MDTASSWRFQEVLSISIAYWHRELEKPREDFKDKMKGAYLGPSYEEFTQ